MKTRPFNAATHKPTDKLVCGECMVTEILIGENYTFGKTTGGRVHRWHNATGQPSDTGCDCTLRTLEVLIPEPEKPREWWLNRYDADTVYMHPTRAAADAADYEGMRTACIHVREVPDPEEAKAGEQQTTEGSAEGRAPLQEDRTQVAKGLPVTAAAQSTTEQPCGHKAGVESRPSTQHIGYVPLHNGVPQWEYAEAIQKRSAIWAKEPHFTGPVVECIVKPKPMTREEAVKMTSRYMEGGGNYLYFSDAVDAILEAANGRADGGEG